MVTAKDEYVGFHRSEETIPEAGSSQSTAHGEPTDPGQVQAVLLGKPHPSLTKGCCWGRSPAASMRALCCGCLVHSQCQPLLATSHTRNEGHGGKNSDSTLPSPNIRAITGQGDPALTHQHPKSVFPGGHFWGSAFFHASGAPPLGGCAEAFAVGSSHLLC